MKIVFDTEEKYTEGWMYCMRVGIGFIYDSAKHTIELDPLNFTGLDVEPEVDVAEYEESLSRLMEINRGVPSYD